MEYLPNEILNEIVEYTYPEDLLSFLLLNKNMNSIVSNSIYFQEFSEFRKKWTFSLENIENYTKPLSVIRFAFRLYHPDKEVLFLCSCQRGHLETAKWIYSLGGVNHHSQQEYAFRWAS